MDLVFCSIIVSFATPSAIYFYICIGVGGQIQPISIRVWRIGTKSFAVINMKPGLVLAAYDMTYFMTWAMSNMGTFHLGIGLSSARKTWALSQLRPLDSLWNQASECAARTIFWLYIQYHH